MGKQDQLAAALRKAGQESSGYCPASEIDWDALAAAVRSFMGSDEVVEAIKRGIAADVLSVMDDYDEVPPEHIFTRPRYEWIRMRLDTIAHAALSAAVGEDIGGGRG